MSSILSRKQVEARATWVAGRIDETSDLAEHTVLAYERRALATALWLAERGRLAAHGSVTVSGGNCFWCPAACEGVEPWPCDTAAEELLKWWGDE